MDFRQM